MDFVTIRSNEAEWRNHLQKRVGKKMPMVIAKGLTRTAFGARKAGQGQMVSDLDRPKSFTKRGIIYTGAKPDRLTASVGIYKDRTIRSEIVERYIQPHVHGGKRDHKAFERQLISRGYMLKSEYAVPAARQRLDRYGNITQGQLNKIMSGLNVDYRGAGATRLASTTRGKSKARARGRYFVPRRSSHLFPGIYFESGGKAKKIHPVLLFVKQKRYKARFDLGGAVYRHADRNLGRNVDIELAKLINSLN